jgi:hypothetical protein
MVRRKTRDREMTTQYFITIFDAGLPIATACVSANDQTESELTAILDHQELYPCSSALMALRASAE